MFLFLNWTKTIEFEFVIIMFYMKMLVENVQKQIIYAISSLIFLSDLLVMCSQLVANPESDAHSQCPDHLHFSTEILCFFPLSPLQIF